MRGQCYYVYILTNKHHSVLYTGVTNSLERRILEHYENRGQQNSFAGKYYAYFLLYYEIHLYVNDAIAREKEIKGWRREKKMALIAEMNPSLEFLNAEVFGAWPPDTHKARL